MCDPKRTPEIRDLPPAAVPDAGAPQESGGTTKRSDWQMRNVLRDPQTFKHRFEDEAMEVVKAIKRDYAPDLDSNDGGEILGWILQVCDRVQGEAMKFIESPGDFWPRADSHQQITNPDEAAGIMRGIADAKAGRTTSLEDIDRKLAAPAAHQERTEPQVGEVWKASDGRRLRVVGNHADGRVACRNVETNRLSYAQRRYFHGATEGNWSLARDTPVGVPARAAEWQPLDKVTRVEVIDETGRVFTRWDCSVQPSFQDDGRTLKLFIEPLPPGALAG